MKKRFFLCILSGCLMLHGCKTKVIEQLPELTISGPSLQVNGSKVEKGMTKPEVYKMLKENMNFQTPVAYEDQKTPEYQAETWSFPMIFFRRLAALIITFKQDKHKGEVVDQVRVTDVPPLIIINQALLVVGMTKEELIEQIQDNKFFKIPSVFLDQESSPYKGSQWEIAVFYFKGPIVLKVYFQNNVIKSFQMLQ